MRFLAVPAVSNLAGPLHDGTTTRPGKRYETVAFGRGISRRPGCGARKLRATTA